MKTARFENLRINGGIIHDGMEGKPKWYKTSDMAGFFVGEPIEAVSVNPNYALEHNLPKGQTKALLCLDGPPQRLPHDVSVRVYDAWVKIKTFIVFDVTACASSPDKNFLFWKFFVPAWIRFIQ